MKIRQLVRKIAGITIRGNRELEVRGLSSHSKKVAPGDLFIARKGEKHDASHYIPDAVKAGAVAIVTDLYDPTLKLTQLIAENPEDLSLEASLAAQFYDHPSKELFTVGVTGSKGKTTTSYLIHHLLKDLLGQAGLISTVETHVGERKFPSTFTTHEPIYNQKILREMVNQGAKGAAFEVSSHGLALKRVEEIHFKLALFTNLYPDHLDFHKTIDDYAAAKKLLFDHVLEKGIFNNDSEWTPYMQQNCRASFTYGIEKPADLIAKNIESHPSHTHFTLHHQNQTAPLSTPLIGRYNIYNFLAAASTGIHLGAPLEQIAASLSRFENVPGRLERISNDKGFDLFVDSAQTGEALDNVLRSLRSLTQKRLLVLFGCGGNREPARRPEMAAAAERHGDLILVTSDNPRHESPEEIIRQILTGFQSRKNLIIEPDRKEAIKKLLSRAEPGDIVLIAGKGHEKVQIIGDRQIPFDDVAIAKEALF